MKCARIPFSGWAIFLMLLSLVSVFAIDQAHRFSFGTLNQTSHRSGRLASSLVLLFGLMASPVAYAVLVALKIRSARLSNIQIRPEQR
jgi:hypothetical protein